MTETHNKKKTHNKMTKYTTEGCRAVMAESMSEAAAIFAGRIARKEMGKSAYCRTCKLEIWRFDGSMGEYNAFIGYTPKGKHNENVTIGKNVRFTVYC